MSTFGAPVTSAPDENTAQSQSAAVPSDAEQVLLDPNDPRLVSEDLAANPEADAYAQPAPPPDGDYRVKLKLLRPKDKTAQEVDYTSALWGKGAKQQAVYVTGLEASIIDASGKYDGLKAFDFNISTFVGRDSATKVMSVLSKLTQPDGKPWSTKHTHGPAKFWMDLLVKALSGEPECGVTTAWSWSCPDCGKEAKAKGTAYPRELVGMHHFPPEQDPKKRAAGQLFSPEVKCQVAAAHGYSRGRITIARFLALAELKK